MFTKRQLRILELIIRNSHGISGPRIAEVIHVTTRTVRSEIVIINKILECYHFTIHSSHKKGYYIDTEYYHSIQKFLKTYLSSSNEDENRSYKILGMLLFEGKQYFIDIADELALAKQSLYRECQQIKEDLLQHYHFDWIKITSNGIECQANENQIRILLLKIMKDLVLSNHVDYLSKIQLLFNDNFYFQEYEKITKQIKKMIQPDDKSLEMLCLAFYMVIMRNRCGFIYRSENTQHYNPLIEMIIDELSLQNYEINRKDQNLLFDYCWGIKLNHDIHQSELSTLSEVIFDEFCKDILHKYDIDLTHCQYVMQNLPIHIEYMLRRIDTDYELKNPMLFDIKKMYPVSYEIAMTMVYIIYKYKKYYLKDDEISYITIYIEYYFHQINQKIKVVIVDEPSAVFNDMIEEWLKTNFMNCLEIVSHVPLHSLKDYLHINDIDLIISMRQIKEELHVPIYIIEGIPYKREYELINSLVHRIKENYHFENLIYKLFDEKFIKYYETEIDFENVIYDLSRQLEKERRIEKSQLFAQKVIKREKMYSTIINRNIATPHPLINDAKQSTIAVALMKYPISLNDRDIKLIFLLALDKYEDRNTYKLFNFFRTISVNRDMTKELLEINNIQEFIKKINYFSKNIN